MIGSEAGRKATLFSATWVKWAREIVDQEQAGQRRDRFRRVPRPLPVPNATSSNLPAWRPSAKPLMGMVEGASNAKRQGLAQLDERLRQGASSELGSTRRRVARDFQQSSPPSFARKWPWRSGNGGFPGLFAFSACRLEMTFSEPRENQGMRHFQMSSMSTPYGGRSALDVAGRPRP